MPGCWGLGVLENYEEGKKYAEHGLWQFFRNKSPEIMPSLNKFLADPKVEPAAPL